MCKRLTQHTLVISGTLRCDLKPVHDFRWAFSLMVYAGERGYSSTDSVEAGCPPRLNPAWCQLRRTHAFLWLSAASFPPGRQWHDNFSFDSVCFAEVAKPTDKISLKPDKLSVMKEIALIRLQICHLSSFLGCAERLNNFCRQKSSFVISTLKKEPIYNVLARRAWWLSGLECVVIFYHNYSYSL